MLNTDRYTVIPYPGPHGRVTYGVTDTTEAHGRVIFWSTWLSAARRWCRRVNMRCLNLCHCDTCAVRTPHYGNPPRCARCEGF